MDNFLFSLGLGVITSMLVAHIVSLTLPVPNHLVYHLNDERQEEESEARKTEQSEDEKEEDSYESSDIEEEEEEEKNEVLDAKQSINEDNEEEEEDEAMIKTKETKETKEPEGEAKRSEDEGDEEPEKQQIQYVDICEYILCLHGGGDKIWNEVVPDKNPYLGPLILNNTTYVPVCGYLGLGSNDFRIMPPIQRIIYDPEKGTEFGIYEFHDLPFDIREDVSEYLQERYFQLRYECLRSPDDLLMLLDDALDISNCSINSNIQSQPSRVLIFGKDHKLDLHPTMNELHVQEYQGCLLVHQVCLHGELGEYIMAEVFNLQNRNVNPLMTKGMELKLIQYYDLDPEEVRCEHTNIWSWVL